MVNKIDGVFIKVDEELFEIFVIYCGFVLYYVKVRIVIMLEEILDIV